MPCPFMAKPRRQYTLESTTVSDLQTYADRYFNGNQSAACDHLLQKAMQEERKQAQEGMVYAGIATAIIFLISLMPWMV